MNDDFVEAARYYLSRGWYSVPVPADRKGPKQKDWPKWRLSGSKLKRHFGRSGVNIGLILGEASGNLVNVDLDCPEAIELAKEYLPPTPALSGKPSTPGSHRWYYAKVEKTTQHRDPVTNDMIVELRSTGGQTLVGPSIHPDTSERYLPLEGEPAPVSGPMLAACVEALYKAVVERRHGKQVTKPKPAPKRDRTVPPADDLEGEKRAIAYLEAMPPAISGQGGHPTTYAAATALVHGFCLSPSRALEILLTHYNSRCDPPWKEKELQHKVDDAANKPHDMPYGWLRDSERTEPEDVDLSAITIHVGERELTPPAERVIDPGPFPEHLLLVPGFVQQVVEYNLATAIKPQPVLAVGAALCLQAVLAARKVCDPRGNRSNLYIIGVAPSGSGKDHARKVNRNILYQAGLEDLEGTEDIASDAGLLSVVEMHPGVLLQMDEFGRFLRTIGDPKKAPHLFNVLGTLMKLYSDADTVYKGKGYAERKRNRSIYQPCVSLYATTVAEHLFESLTPESISDGFMARQMAFEAWGESKRQRSPRLPIPDAILQTARWWGEFNPGGNLQKERPEPLLVDYTSAAGRVFDELADQVDSELAKKEVTGHAVWARAEEKACRLALVYACSRDHDNLVIDEAAAEWACELSAYLTRRMIYLANLWVADSVFDARQKKVIRLIRDAGGQIGHSELYNKTRSMTPRERSEVIENLIATEQIERNTIATATKPKVVYDLL